MHAWRDAPELSRAYQVRSTGTGTVKVCGSMGVPQSVAAYQ